MLLVCRIIIKNYLNKATGNEMMGFSKDIEEEFLNEDGRKALHNNLRNLISPTLVIFFTQKRRFEKLRFLLSFFA